MCDIQIRKEFINIMPRPSKAQFFRINGNFSNSFLQLQQKGCKKVIVGNAQTVKLKVNQKQSRINQLWAVCNPLSIISAIYKCNSRICNYSEENQVSFTNIWKVLKEMKVSCIIKFSSPVSHMFILYNNNNIELPDFKEPLSYNFMIKTI